MAFNLILDSNVKTGTQVNQRFDQYFSQNEPLNKYGIKGTFCMKWVRLALEEIGLRITTTTRNPNAWDMFAALPNKDMKYLKLTKRDTEFGWSNEELVNFGVKDGSLLFGYYKVGTSPSKNFSASKASIEAVGSEKIPNLTKYATPFVKNPSNQNVSGGYNQVTHIGIFYNSQFYNLIGQKKSTSVFSNPTFSFQPVAHYPIIDVWKNRL